MTRPARPLQIGPYRLEDRLGAGGMGEVYAAWDERLGRRVAVKLIRPEAELSESARERFRREARAAASLNHPAIVQLYDLVSFADGEALVLELVEGETLEERLRRGPLPLPTLLTIAHALCGALATAHARGLIHRDLKPANVMLTPAGLPKVLDFGVAKRLGGESDDLSLSLAGGLIGTPWAMSPEQARSLQVDQRSDLFALGALLYEAATGVHPFRGASTLDSLNNVCSLEQAPANELVPQLPAAFSALLDELLAKEPARRPADASTVAATLDGIHIELTRSGEWPPLARAPGAAGTLATATMLPPGLSPTLAEGGAAGGSAGADTGRGPAAHASPAPARPPAAGRPGGRFRAAAWGVAALVLASGGLALWRLWPAPAAQPRMVAVPTPEIAAAGQGTAVPATVREMADSLRLSLLRGLLGLDGLLTPAPEQVDEVQGSPADVARALAADELLSARLSCEGASCRVTLSRIAASGALLWTQAFAAPLDQPYLLPEAVAGYLRAAYPERRPRPGMASVEARPEDYGEYLRLETAYQQQGEAVGIDQLLTRLAALRASSPHFLEPALFEAQLRRYRFRLERDPADLESARSLLENARRQAPADPRPLLVLFEVDVASEDLTAARTTLAALERLQPGDPGLLSRRARLLEREGKPAAALAEMRLATDQQPSWHHLFRLADMEYRLGASSEARGTLERLLARYPGSYAGRSLLAQIELLSGNAERAAGLYEELVSEHSGVEELTNLSAAYLLLGDYPRAEARAAAALAADPGNPWARLNQADATLLAGEAAAARALYRQILAAVEGDSAPGWELRSLAAQALAHLGERQRAVAEVQEVQRLAPDNPQAAFEAAVVYALVGDEASALVAIEKARLGGRGVAARWFSLPWFAPLAARGELKALLTESPRS